MVFLGRVGGVNKRNCFLSGLSFASMQNRSNKEGSSSNQSVSNRRVGKAKNEDRSMHTIWSYVSGCS